MPKSRRFFSRNQCRYRHIQKHWPLQHALLTLRPFPPSGRYLPATSMARLRKLRGFTGSEDSLSSLPLESAEMGVPISMLCWDTFLANAAMAIQKLLRESLRTPTQAGVLLEGAAAALRLLLFASAPDTSLQSRPAFTLHAAVPRSRYPGHEDLFGLRSFSGSQKPSAQPQRQAAHCSSET